VTRLSARWASARAAGGPDECRERANRLDKEFKKVGGTFT